MVHPQHLEELDIIYGDTLQFTACLDIAGDCLHCLCRAEGSTQTLCVCELDREGGTSLPLDLCSKTTILQSNIINDNVHVWHTVNCSLFLMHKTRINVFALSSFNLHVLSSKVT